MQPLLADIADIIGVIITLAIIGFSVVSKIIGANNQAPKNRPPQRRNPPPQGGGVQNRPGKAGAANIEAEIEDFLRQARGGGQQPQARAAAPPAPPAAPRRVVEAEPVAREPGKNFGRGLAEHVEQHIGRDSISTRDAHLAESVEMADERVEHHLEEVFDHDVGHLAHVDDTDTSISEGTDEASYEKAPTSSTVQTATAKRIIEMLKSPNGVRDVLIAAEVLKRPEI